MSEKINVLKLFRETVAKDRPDARIWFNQSEECYVIETPRDHRFHGSAFAVKCNKKCVGEGDLVTLIDSDIVEEVSKLIEDAGCSVEEIHEHPLFNEAHIHFLCVGLDEKGVRKILDLIKYF